MKAFKSVVVHEVRANFLLGLFGLLSVPIVLAAILLSSPPIANVMLPPFFVATSIICALVGLVIGLAQTLPESRADRWSFLAHRPMPRTALFLANALAGLILYAAAAGIPIVVALLWMSRPGHLAFPFDWRIGIPPLADFICGGAFYFAGVLTAMGGARWHLRKALGVRDIAFPVVVAFVCLLLQMGVLLPIPQTFLGAMLCVGAGILVLGTAAWGAFASGGNYGTQSPIQRVATGIVFTIALTVLSEFVTGLVPGVGVDPSDQVRQDYTVTSDGAIVKIAFDGVASLLSITDPQDLRLEKYRNRIGKSRETLSSGVSTVDFFPDGWQWHHYRQTGGIFKNFGMLNQKSWYYVHRLGLIATFDPSSRRLVGWLGPEGFTPGDTPPARRFEGKPQIGVFFMPRQIAALLTFPDAVYRVVLDENRVEKVFTPEPGEIILAATAEKSLAATPRAAGESTRVEVVLTSKRIVITEVDGTVFNLPNDPRFAGNAYLHIARARNAPGTPIIAIYRTQRNTSAQVAVWDQGGNLMDQKSLPPLGPLSTPSTFSESVTNAALPLARLYRILRGDIDLMLMILSTLSGLAAYALGRAFAFPSSRLLLWAALGLLLGPLGFAVMFLLHDWPARERCSACNRLRVVTRERCEHCSEAFAGPKLDGTEIFEQL